VSRNRLSQSHSALSVAQPQNDALLHPPPALQFAPPGRYARGDTDSHAPTQAETRRVVVRRRGPDRRLPAGVQVIAVSASLR
jgi:hypothetical protein